MEEILFGKNYKIEETVEEDEKIIIKMTSNKVNCKCPKCGKLSDYYATYTRNIQDTPLRCKETWLCVKVHKYMCLNPKCTNFVFSEELEFAKQSQVKTDALLNTILAVSIFLSNSASSLVLSLIGIKVSADTIKNLYDKIEIIDDPDIEEVGIDDVATRKGQKYATAIYDLKTHNLIALLEGRDANTLKDWLKKHKKIKVVARDRASAYATAINEILPDCMQVADRFHLLQNLIEKLKDIFYKEVPKEIFIKNGEILEKAPKKEIDIYVEESILEKINYDNTPPVDEKGNEIKYDRKRRNLDSTAYIRRREVRQEKKKMIIAIQERWKEEKDLKVLKKEFKKSIPAIKKYIQMSKEEIDKLDEITKYKERKKKSLIEEYKNIIYKMIRDNYSYKMIYAYVIYKGYKGSQSCLNDYIYLINKNNFPNKKSKNPLYEKEKYPKDITVIKRNELLKYILTIDDKKKKNEDIEKNIEIIKKAYPIVQEIETIFKEFHSIIMGTKTEDLDTFLEKYQDSKISIFCNGIKKDIAAVKNAISSKISSGFVEGNNNKFKLIKRIIYGKAKLVNLFRKCFLAFKIKNTNFSILDLI